MRASIAPIKHKTALVAAASLGLSALCGVAVYAKNQPLPDSIESLPDKLIKYEHLKNRPGRDGKNYDVKIQYGRTSERIEGVAFARNSKARTMIAFTRVLISPVGKNNYRKPSADKLSELFPGSMVYTSLNGAELSNVNRCGKKKWHKSREYTTFVSLKKRICGSKGFDTGHRAKIGNQLVVDKKL
ncbi:MAG: hypothetical protein AAF687_06570 [Pseudomonadota bacterium]